MDVCFREVQSRAGARHSAENLATLRRLALNLLKREKTKIRGIKGKQLNAGWDHAYLAQALWLRGDVLHHRRILFQIQQDRLHDVGGDRRA